MAKFITISNRAFSVTQALLKVSVLSANNFKSTIQKGVTFVKFYSPECGHCRMLAPIWEELAVKLTENKINVKMAKVDCTEQNNTELCISQQVETIPALFIYKNGKRIQTYTGNRELDSLYKFVVGQNGAQDGKK